MALRNVGCICRLSEVNLSLYAASTHHMQCHHNQHNVMLSRYAPAYTDSFIL